MHNPHPVLQVGRGEAWPRSTSAAQVVAHDVSCLPRCGHDYASRQSLEVQLKHDGISTLVKRKFARHNERSSRRKRMSTATSLKTRKLTIELIQSLEPSVSLSGDVAQWISRN